MKNFILLLLIVFMTSCHSRREVLPVPDDGGIHLPRPELVRYPVKEVNMVPQAVIYRTSGDFNNHVFITLATDGSVISYPAPTDVTEDSAPIVLKNGWLLDRRGISKNAAFLKWTYAEYHALTTAPSIAQLKEEIIPGARVTTLYQLPMTPWEAASDTAAVNRWIAENLTLTLK